MSTEIFKIITLTAASANAIALSQKPAAGGVQNLTINGALATAGVATLDTDRRILITSSTNDSTIIFTITGTNRYGMVTETVTGVNTTAYTVYDYETITSITVDTNTAGNITVGTNGVASTAWVPCDMDSNPFSISVWTSISSGASLTYTIECTPIVLTNQPTSMNPYTVSDNNFFNVPSRYIYPTDDLTMVAASTSLKSNFAYPTDGVRLTINSFVSGSVTLFVKQNA